MIRTGNSDVLDEKLTPVPLCSPQIAHRELGLNAGLCCDRAMVTAPDMTRNVSSKFLNVFLRVFEGDFATKNGL
jgi:hypothetical protein